MSVYLAGRRLIDGAQGFDARGPAAEVHAAVRAEAHRRRVNHKATAYVPVTLPDGAPGAPAPLLDGSDG